MKASFLHSYFTLGDTNNKAGYHFPVSFQPRVDQMVGIFHCMLFTLHPVRNIYKRLQDPSSLDERKHFGKIFTQGFLSAPFVKWVWNAHAGDTTETQTWTFVTILLQILRGNITVVFWIYFKHSMQKLLQFYRQSQLPLNAEKYILGLWKLNLWQYLPLKGFANKEKQRHFFLD